MKDDQSEADPMLKALTAELPGKLAQCAVSSNDLFIVSACAATEARRNVVELASPPRVAKELHRS